MTRAACKAAGAILNEFHRDIPKFLAQGWPVVNLARADFSGVLIVSKEVEGAVIAKALEKARVEITVRPDIEQGAPVRAACKKHGVL